MQITRRHCDENLEILCEYKLFNSIKCYFRGLKAVIVFADRMTSN